MQRVWEIFDERMQFMAVLDAGTGCFLFAAWAVPFVPLSFFFEQPFTTDTSGFRL